MSARPPRPPPRAPARPRTRTPAPTTASTSPGCSPVGPSSQPRAESRRPTTTDRHDAGPLPHPRGRAAVVNRTLPGGTPVKLENEFTVPVDIDTVFDALNDPEKVTPCFPGATLDSHEGDDFTGTVKVKLGPISMTYKGKGTFVERDKTNHKVVVDAQGRDSRGNGTASAKATLTMTDEGGKTKVNVLTEMQVTGKPAQFGRGVMSDVGDKILGQFASSLADEFGSSSAG